MSKSGNVKKKTKKEPGNEPFTYPPELSASFVVRIAFRLMQRDLEATLSSTGVSRGQWFFLRALWAEDGLTQRELSIRVGMMEPTTVVALNGMEKAKLIRRTRDRVDRRKVRVHLTEYGRNLADKLLPLVKKINDRATAGISPQDLRKFHVVIEKMTENLRTGEH
ncbi:MAG: MarR family winged helix-turn-helix transcriptional regulator [Alphaproteobacteria bacterium]